MMDGTAMYPEGFHPSVQIMHPSGMKIAPVLRRCDVPSVKYYFIDFGISYNKREGESGLLTGNDGQDRDVPELSIKVPYDPFLVDVFILGNVYRKTFLLVRLSSFSIHGF